MEPTIFKLNILGENCVGKTSLAFRYSRGEFRNTKIIGIDIFTKQIELDGANVKVQLWPLYRSERCAPISGMFFKGSKGCLVVFDITDLESYKSVQYYIDIYRKANEDADPSPSIVLIGNKSDLNDERKVKYEEALKLAEDNDIKAYFETSAKTGEFTIEAIESLVKLNFQ